MSSFYSKLFIVLLGLLSLTTSVTAQADDSVTTTTVEKRVIITPVPAPKETIVTPSGSVACYKVEGGYHNDVWVPEHSVCQYKNSKVWVESYWKCTAYTIATGDCTNWVWVPAHWVDLY